MPRERIKLSDKQERIIVQCQLMGITTRDMVQISNRLVAIEKEAFFKKTVEQVMSHIKSYNFDKKKSIYTIVDDTDTEYTIKLHKKQHYRTDLIDISFSTANYGSKDQKKTYKNQTVYPDLAYYEISKFCPENSKLLFRLCKDIVGHRWN